MQNQDQLEKAGTPPEESVTRGKSAILYSQIEPSPDHQKVTTDKGDAIYIRAETVVGGIGYALDIANPRDTETVLNSIWLSEQAESSNPKVALSTPKIVSTAYNVE